MSSSLSLRNAAALGRTAIHRPLSVLFCDLVGSVALTGSLDLEAARDVIRSWQEQAAQLAEANGGFVARFMGDGLLAYYGYPCTREDDAERAVRTGLAILHDAANGAAGGRARLQVRVGVATGMVLVDEAIGSGMAREIPTFGPAINLAARLHAEAPPGGLVVDDSTRAALRGLFEFVGLGPRRLKGIAQPVAAFLAVSSREVRSRFAARHAATWASAAVCATAIVGRGAELSRLSACIRRDGADGLRLAVVRGEPGIGKSRLLHELAGIARAAGTPLLHGECTPARRDAPFGALAEIICWSFRLKANEACEVTVLRMTAALRQVGLDSPDNTTLMLRLLGSECATGQPEPESDPTLAHRRAQTLLRQLLRAACGEARAVLMIEDVQWLDRSSRQFLAEFVRSEAGLPLTILVSSRDEAEPDWLIRARPAAGPSPPDDCLLTLRPLTPDQIGLLVGAQCAGRRLPEGATRSIVDRSGGNPLFAEALVSLVLETDDPADAAGVPDSVSRITACRLDRLTLPARRLLETASIIGAHVPVPLLAEVLGAAPSQVHDMMCQAHELVVPIDDDGQAYRFRHALVHEAILSTLLPSHRRQLHARIAATLQAQGGAVRHADALAAHHSAAGEVEAAVDCLLVSGDHRLAMYALDEADRCFIAALAAIEGPGSSMRLRLPGVLVRRMRVLELRGAFGEIIALAERTLPLLEAHDAGASDNDLQLCQVLGNYAHALLHRHEYDASERAAQRALSIAERLGASVPGAIAKLAVMRLRSARDTTGDNLATVERLGAEIIAVAEHERSSYLACAARFQLALHYLHDGELAPARLVAADLARQGERFDDPRPRSFARWLEGWILLHDRQFEAAAALAEASLNDAVIEVDRSIGLGLRGALLALTRRPDEALAILRPLHAEVVARQDLNQAAVLEPPMAVAMIMQGRLFAGLALLRAATRRRTRSGCVAMSFYGHLVQGEILAALVGPSAPSASVGAGVLLRVIRPLARRSAARHLATASRHRGWRPGSAAQIRISLARAKLLQLPRHAAERRTLLLDAQKMATAAGCDGLAREAGAALRID